MGTLRCKELKSLISMSAKPKLCMQTENLVHPQQTDSPCSRSLLCYGEGWDTKGQVLPSKQEVIKTKGRKS